MRWWEFAKPLESTAPVAPSPSSDAFVPSFQLSFSTFEMPGSSPATWTVLPKARPSPARTPATTVATPELRSASADETDVGVKPSCEVSA